MVKRMKIVDGQLTLLPKCDREMMKDMIDMLFGDIDEKDRRIAEMREKLNSPTDERLVEAHKIINDLREQLGDYRRNSLYVMTKEQKEESAKWWNEHRKECSGKGRLMEWVVTGTGFGDCLVYRCRHCGKSLDLTDTSKW